MTNMKLTHKVARISSLYSLSNNEKPPMSLIRTVCVCLCPNFDLTNDNEASYKCLPFSYHCGAAYGQVQNEGVSKWAGFGEP